MNVSKTESAILLTDLVMTVFKLNGSILRAAEDISADTELTPARWQVLGIVLDKPLTVSSIARHLGLTRQSVQRLANALVEDKMAIYLDNPAHARASLLKPTGHGLKTIAQLADKQSTWANTITQSMSEKKISHCLEVLNELVEHIETENNL